MKSLTSRPPLVKKPPLRMPDTPAHARPAPLSQRVAGVVARGAGGGNGNQVDEGLGQGMEMALTVLVFLGIGFLLDSIFGTKPLLTIIFVVFAMVGTFVKMYLAYSLRMKALEAERAAARRAHQSGGDA